MKYTFPFSAIVGQDLMKKALILNVIDPTIGGVLIRGERVLPNPLLSELYRSFCRNISLLKVVSLIVTLTKKPLYVIFA